MGEGSAQPTDTQHTPTFDMPPLKPKKTQKPRQPKRKTTKVPQPSESIDIATDEAVHKEGVDSLVRATTTASSLEAEKDSEDELKRIKTAQQTKIDSLERRIKKLDKKHMSKTHKLKRLYKVGLTARIDEIDADEDIALVSTHDDVSIQDNFIQYEGIEDVGEEEVVEVVTTVKMIIDAILDAAQVTTAIADIPVSAAETIVPVMIKKFMLKTQSPR
nr:hypothetical protein [Tanacetum cinerariifolium]